MQGITKTLIRVGMKYIFGLKISDVELSIVLSKFKQNKQKDHCHVTMVF